jgi:hypothetical protein
LWNPWDREIWLMFQNGRCSVPRRHPTSGHTLQVNFTENSLSHLLWTIRI